MSNDGSDCEIPSKVKDETWIYSGFNTYIRDMKRLGKWIIFLNCVVKDCEGLTKQDRVWLKLLELVRTGVISSISSSTARAVEGEFDPETGVVFCYTSDFTDVEEVRAAAEEIRKSIGYTRPLYYKTQCDSDERKLRSRGCKDVSLYVCTKTNELLVRDDDGVLIPVRSGGKSLEEYAPTRCRKLLDKVRERYAPRPYKKD